MDVKLESLNNSDKRKIETAEMRFLRHVTGYTIRDEIINLTIRSELKILNINDKIKEKKKQWHDHIQRMDPYGIAGKAVEYEPIGHRDVGLPNRRWEDDF
jgi:Zn-dependent metalloprotease